MPRLNAVIRLVGSGLLSKIPSPPSPCNGKTLFFTTLSTDCYFGRRCARRYMLASDLVEDVTHQAYLDFIQGGLKGKWDLTGNLDALLYQITKRAAQVCWREQRKHGGQYVDRLRQHLLDACKAKEENDNETYERMEKEIAMLHRCMEKLPPQSRYLIEQHYFEGKKINEIGRKQQVKEMSSLYHYFIRIRQKLRKCMESSIRDLER